MVTYTFDHWEDELGNTISPTRPTTPYVLDLIISTTNTTIIAVYAVIAPLTVNAHGPYSTLPSNPTIQFQGSAIGGTPPYTWDWDFGEGSPHGTEQNPIHTYPSTEAVYTVTLTATDSLSATASATTTATVSPTLPTLRHTSLWLFVHSFGVSSLWNFPLIEAYDQARAKSLMS